MTKIIIYDDHLARRDSLEALLSLSGEHSCVGSFESCVNVLQDIKELEPDVILMDIEMPDMSGLDGVKLIKTKYEKVKVIIQTSYDDDDKIFDALRFGAVGYILKSASINQILQSIDEVLQGGAYMTPSVAIKVANYFNSSANLNHNNTTLSAREKEVLVKLSGGLSYKMVADELGISFYTVNNHIKKIYDKLQVHSLGEAIAYAHKTKLV